MTVHFTKMQGAGNDYLFLDGFADAVPAELPVLVKRLSDRRFGVGADGVIVVEPSESADFRMRIFNADGGEAELCGNGLRCAYRYLRDRAHIESDRASAQTVAGVFAVGVDRRESGWVWIEMPAPRLGEIVALDVGRDRFTVHEVVVGNPHAVVFLAPDADLDQLELDVVGPAIERHERYPDRVNVEFAVPRSRTRVAQRTWERGAGETLACGTGACAVVAAGVAANRLDPSVDVHVQLRGGSLRVRGARGGDSVELSGPAVEVFSGVWSEPLP